MTPRPAAHPLSEKSRRTLIGSPTADLPRNVRLDTPVPLYNNPVTAAPALTIPAGTTITIVGEDQHGRTPVVCDGASGWIDAAV